MSIDWRAEYDNGGKLFADYWLQAISRSKSNFAIFDTDRHNISDALQAMAESFSAVDFIKVITHAYDGFEANGELALLESYLSQAREIVRAEKLSFHQAQIEFYNARLMTQKGQFKEADAKLQDILNRFDLEHNRALYVQIRQLQAGLLGKLGKYELARKLLLEVLSAQRAGIETEKMHITLGQLNVIAWHRGDYAEAEKYFPEAEKLALAAQDNRALTRLYVNVATNEGSRGNYALCEKYMEYALDAARKVSDIEQICQVYRNFGVLNIVQGNYTQAKEFLSQSLLEARKIGFLEGMQGTLLNLGVIFLRQDQLQRARNAFEESLELARILGTMDQATALSNLGLTAIKLARFDEARAYLQEGLEVARLFDNPLLICGALIDYGELCLATADLEKAATLYLEAIELTRAKGIQDMLAEASFGLAKVFHQQGDTQQAEMLANRSLQTFKTIGHAYQGQVEEFLTVLKQN